MADFALLGEIMSRAMSETAYFSDDFRSRENFLPKPLQRRITSLEELLNFVSKF